MKSREHKPYTAVKMWLAGHGITYKQVADVLGLTEATVQMKLNGKSDFYITEQIAMSEKLGLDPLIFFAKEIA